MRPIRRSWLAAALCLCLATLAWAGGKVEELGRLLGEDPSYKVRVQAALVLGKLGDPAGVPPLTKALGDPNRMVRAIAAQSLGRLGVPGAAAGLRSLLKQETDSFVRKEIDKALALLKERPETKSRLFLTFGSFSGGVRSADAQALEILREALKKELGKLTAATMVLQGDEKSFGKTGQMGFLIDGNVTRLDDGTAAGSVEINCDVKVMVARWPSKSIILWTNAGAAVQGGSRPRDRENARRDCLEASAGQLGEDLLKFFQSQGG